MAVGEVGPVGQHSKYHFNGPSVPTEKEEISSVSTEAFPSRRGRGMGRERGLELQLWGPPTGGRGAHKSKGRKKLSKGKDGSCP